MANSIGVGARADAKALTHALRGRWHGSYGAAPCPVCQLEQRQDQNALTLADGRGGLLLHCKRSGCDFRDVLAAAGLAPGDAAPPDPVAMAARERERRADVARRASAAARLWRESRPIVGTVAETYLREARALREAPLAASLRFHATCWHGPTAQRWPALLARVEGGDGFAVHRTYLRPDGSGKAPIEPAKAMLGAAGGGAVRLAPGSNLIVGEGIESTLAALTLHDGPAGAWAALSTSGLRGLRLPDQPGRLTIATDGDEPGRAAAVALAERAHAAGWAVAIADPGDGLDWADVLQAEAGR